MWKQKNNRVNKMIIKFNTLTNYTTLYHTYLLLYCKGHIQITSNHSNGNVETKKNNRVNKMTTNLCKHQRQLFKLHTV